MKRIFGVAFSLLLAILLYYLFMRPFEFEVNFKARTLPGDVIETLRIWSRSLDDASVVAVDSFNRLEQTIVWNDRKYNYTWNFNAIDDSATNVNIQISEPGKNLLNKLLVPFTNQAIEKDANAIAKQFYDILKHHLEITRVRIIGEVELDAEFCACRSLETSQIDKANGMMRDFPVLTSFINDFKLKPDGPPIVSITQWNHSLGRLTFDFCFPITRSGALPVTEAISYKELGKAKALKAEYYGNYITSDRAWYELIHYAQKNGYATTGLPREYFHDNPNLGFDEKEWKADVYLLLE